MDILIADTFPDEHLNRLRAGGHACDYAPDLDEQDLPSRIAGFDALVVRSTKVTAETINAADRLGIVVRAGAGTNTIDTRAAAERAVYVCNTPGKNSIAVAELTMGLLMAVDRRIPDNVADLRRRRWNKRQHARARGLYGRAMGIVGLGEVGLAVAERAAAFGLSIHAIRKPDRSPAALERLEAIGARWVDDIEALAKTCDILTFHIPATKETVHLIDREFLTHVQPNAVIINTSRGDIIDEEALIDAMNEKGIRAALDVFREEPPTSEGPFGSALAQHPNVYGTHHIGASTEQAQNAIAAEVTDVLEAFAEGRILHCVNLEVHPEGTTTLRIRHHNRVGVLSGVFSILKGANLNVENMDNQIFAGSRAATATIHVRGRIEPDLIAEIEKVDNVIRVSVRDDFAPGSGMEPRTV